MKPKTSSGIFSAEEIEAMIEAAPETVPFDPDCPPIRPEDWKDAVFVNGGGVSAVKAALDERRRTRGPNRQPTKRQVAIRLSPEVVAFFKAGGPGWQTRVDAILKDYVRAHS